MEPIVLPKSSNLLKLPEQLYGTIKRVGILNKEPILYGDVNLLRPNDLYYISKAKLVYRYVKASIEDSSITYYFDTIKSTATDSLSVPEDERGKIRNAGYLFNEIIYSGDPNLVDNGLLFYHDTLPYISVISNVDGIINVSTKKVRIDGTIVTIVNEYMVYTPHDYSKDYLTFRALEKGSFKLDIPYKIDATCMESVSYSVDNGKTWVTTQINNSQQTITTPTINAGDKVLWKGIGKQTAKSNTYLSYSQFTSTKNFKISGNIMSIFYGDDFTSQTTFPQNSLYNLAMLFTDATKLIDIENLVLPATILTPSCYYYMFKKCTSLKTISSNLLPATTLATSCYSSMFWGCTSLTEAPELPATTLANICYGDMFWNCTSLIEAPELPATILADNCYYRMFYGCTSLTTASELPATTLANSCYESMFNSCTSLANAPKLPAIVLTKLCYSSMFSSCKSLTTAPELPATTLTEGCYQSMFGGTSIQIAPELPVTVLANNCYQYMFSSCTLLTTAPVLPATTLVTGCYMGMFSGCTALATAPELPSMQLADNCYYGMFRNCTSLTTAPALPATTLATSCYGAMFTGCTSLTTAPELPATTLVDYCYGAVQQKSEGMFQGCTALTTAPVLPAITLVTHCYRNMFKGCTNLNYIKAMFTTAPSTNYTSSWVDGVAATGTFVKSTSASWTTTGVNGIPTGWTVETASS